MKITFLNVGYGECFLIENNGFNILIDGGSSYESEYTEQNRTTCKEFLKKKNITSIDLLILTHIHEDHICGIENILNSVSIKEIWTNVDYNLFKLDKKIVCSDYCKENIQKFTKAINSYSNILNFVKKNNIPIKTIYKSDNIYNTFGFNLKILAPIDKNVSLFENLIKEVYETSKNYDNLLIKLDALSNDTALVLKVYNEDYSAILTSDSIPRNYDFLPECELKTDVLKLSHHGQFDSYDENQIKKSNPKYIITSTSSDRRNSSANENVFINLTNIFSDNISFLFTDEKDYQPYFKSNKDFSQITIYFSNGDLKYLLI